MSLEGKWYVILMKEKPPKNSLQPPHHRRRNPNLTMAIRQSLEAVYSQPNSVPATNHTLTYAATLHPTPIMVQPIRLKPVAYLHGELSVIWEEE